MNELPEYMSKAELRGAGVPTPAGQVISTTADGGSGLPPSIEPPVVVKAQIPVSGRGKEGGIVFAETTQAARDATEELLGSTIGGKVVEEVLVEERVQITDELYLSFSADGSAERPSMIFSTRGGQEIESTDSAYITSRGIDPLTGVYPYHVQELLDAVEDEVPVSGRELYQLVEPVWRLFRRLDLRLFEINPIGITRAGELCAIDAKCVIDSAARFRQSHENVHTTLTDIEERASDEEIDLRTGDGEIGIVSNGAGIALAMIDYIAHNTDTTFSGFVDTHGAQFEETYIERSLHHLSECGSRAVIVNIQGPFIDCVPVARAVTTAIEEGYDSPVVARFKGYRDEQARRRCELAGITTVTDITKTIATADELRGGRR